MFLREMNSACGLCKKKYSLGTKKPGAFLELEGQRAKIIDPLNMWNEWLAMASSSALEVHGFSLESDFMSHPIKGPQMWSAVTSPPGTRHSCCSDNSINSKSQVPFSALLLAWESLKSSFLDGPSDGTEAGLQVLSTMGQGWKRGTALQAQIQTFIFPIPCPVSWSLHKHHVPSLLISPGSQEPCCPCVDMEKLQEKTGGSPTSIALLRSTARGHSLTTRQKSLGFPGTWVFYFPGWIIWERLPPMYTWVNVESKSSPLWWYKKRKANKC